MKFLKHIYKIKNIINLDVDPWNDNDESSNAILKNEG